MLVGIGHVDLVCRDLQRSLAFYAAVFGGLGLEQPHLVDGERDEQIHYLRFPAAGSGSLGLRQALQDQQFELYAPGLHHLALAVESDADVDAAHPAADAAGAGSSIRRGSGPSTTATTTACSSVCARRVPLSQCSIA